jgi:hypothetical protein
MDRATDHPKTVYTPFRIGFGFGHSFDQKICPNAFKSGNGGFGRSLYAIFGRLIQRQLVLLLSVLQLSLIECTYSKETLISEYDSIPVYSFVVNGNLSRKQNGPTLSAAGQRCLNHFLLFRN